MTIHLAVKTGHPQYQLSVDSYQFKVDGFRVVILKERTAKVQLFSIARKGLEKNLAVFMKFLSLQSNNKEKQPKKK